jgi:DNA-binding Xre family transcriptional regulator
VAKFSDDSDKASEIAAKHGIKNAYQLQQRTGFPPAMSARLWREQWSAAHLTTLNSLCNLFKCTPNDILKFTPDPDED